MTPSGNLPVDGFYQDNSSPAYGVREHLSVIFRHKRKILAIALTAILVAGPGSFLMTNIYSAEVRLLIQSSRTPFSMSTPLTGQVFTPAELNQKDDVATEVQIFTSPVLLDKLVDQFGTERVLSGMRGRWDWVFDVPTIFSSAKPERAHYDAVQKLKAALTVEGVRQTQVFTAALDAPNPEFATEALNALVDIYLDHHLAVHKGKGSSEFFDEQTSQMRNNLHEAEHRLQAFKDKWNIVSIDDQKRSSLQQVTQIEAALREERVLPRREELSNRLKSYRDTLNMLDQREVELLGLMRDVKIKQEALDLYLKKGEESRINEVLDRKGISNVSTIELASVPQKTVRPRKFLNFVMGLLVGLLGGLGSAYVSEYVRRSFVTRQEAQHTLKQPVIALPLVGPEASDANIFNVELRHAAQRVSRAYHERGLRTILITSTLPGEGRSRVAAELAGALNDLKFRVLLMTIGNVTQSGTVMRTHVASTDQGPQVVNRDTEEVLESTDRPHLSRLCVQNSSGTALDLAERLIEIAKTMRDRFDLIVLDGPPVPLFPEMRVTVAAFDGTMLVVEAERTTGAAATRTLEAIQDAGGHVLGIVLNKCQLIIPSWFYERWLASGRGERSPNVAGSSSKRSLLQSIRLLFAQSAVDRNQKPSDKAR